MVAISTLALLNLSGWPWGVVAGFCGSMMRSLLDLLFYPLSPINYGFAIQRTLGRRSAIWLVFYIACVVALIITSIALNSKSFPWSMVSRQQENGLSRFKGADPIIRLLRIPPLTCARRICCHGIPVYSQG